MFMPTAFFQQYQTILWQQSVATMQLSLSAIETITHRTNMMLAASMGTIPLNHPEFSRMGLEKVQAGIDGNVAMFKEWQKHYVKAVSSPSYNVNDFWKSAQSALTQTNALHNAGLKPTRTKAQANAKRLRRS